MLMNVLKKLTDVAKKKTVQTLQDHITVSVKSDTREMDTIAQVLISYISVNDVFISLHKRNELQKQMYTKHIYYLIVP